MTRRETTVFSPGKAEASTGNRNSSATGNAKAVALMANMTNTKYRYIPVGSVPPEIRRGAGLIAVETGYHPQTVIRAIVEGIDAIRPQKIRDELRPHVEAFHASRRAGRAA